MGTFKQAPQIYFRLGEYEQERMKENGCVSFYWNELTFLFEIFGGRDGNLIKLMLTFLTRPEGYYLSLEDMLFFTRMTKTAYYKARKDLQELGLIEVTEGKVIVLMDKIIEGGKNYVY